MVLKLDMSGVLNLKGGNEVREILISQEEQQSVIFAEGARSTGRVNQMIMQANFVTDATEEVMGTVSMQINPGSPGSIWTYSISVLIDGVNVGNRIFDRRFITGEGPEIDSYNGSVCPVMITFSKELNAGNHTIEVYGNPTGLGVTGTVWGSVIAFIPRTVEI